MLSKELKEYGDLKGVGINAVKRMQEFLGDEIVKGSKLNCPYIISKKPIDSPITERSIPISIFSSEPAIKKKFLRK